jgi:hypothetical protein
MAAGLWCWSRSAVGAPKISPGPDLFDPHDVTAIAKAMTEISSGSRDLCAMGRSIATSRLDGR